MEEFKDKFNTYTVLVVEDDLIIKEKVVTILEFFFKEVYQSDNGIDAYEIFLEEKPDLIISDIEMENDNGIELIKKVRKINLDIPIIVLSAYSKEEYLLKLINLKIAHYILKPATNKKLFEAISIALLKEQKVLLKLCENMYLDTERNLIKYKNEEISLRKKEKYFLELLYKNKDKITNYELIQEYIWTDKYMTQNALKTFIKELRKKLPVQIIENVIQEGYRLVKN
ncbi:DNA-binding response regulator [Halarcobacter mediterraneus]|uniref:DNA-binding response regulator n=1 Tax=Halarcobacter mediterraneus TaxID=2023153 RepID=A0A4Q1ARP5_9BACT|nr:DNA-binding response regulator [Halarcobacter mediterraneus]RXK12205.1 DNA-binding response regulator [Halarcobacter mediterraneus]